MNFFYYESKFKIRKNKKNIVAGGEMVGLRGARVSDFFFTKNPNLKKIFLGGGGSGGVGWGEEDRGRGRWMDRRTGPNQFAPSTCSKLGHNNALMYMLCKLCL